MKKYVIWDKESDLFTPGVDKETGKSQWTAEEYIAQRAPWAALPNVKVIVAGGVINGSVFLEFESTREAYQKAGALITDGMTDEEVLQAIADFEDNPPKPEPSAEERIAAALEFQNLLSM